MLALHLVLDGFEDLGINLRQRPLHLLGYRHFDEILRNVALGDPAKGLLLVAHAFLRAASKLAPARVQDADDGRTDHHKREETQF